MGHVDHEDRADFLGDFGEAREIDPQGEGGGASDDQFRLVFARLGFHRVVVDVFRGVESIGHHLEPFAAHVERHAVGEMAAFGQTHAHDGVARLAEGHQHRLVGLRAGMGLHVGGFCAEQLLDPIDRQLLGDVHPFAAAVIALARITFRILVGEHRTLRLHHGRAGVVLRRDQFDMVFLALGLALDGGPQLGIGAGDA